LIKFDEASVGSSITIELENDISESMIVKSSELPKVEKDINTTVCWMDSKKLPGRNILYNTILTEFWLKLTA
jgi:sulfate adenylyltransferase subunit 1 (EFTu-like GTPase family)